MEESSKKPGIYLEMLWHLDPSVAYIKGGYFFSDKWDAK